MACVHSYLPWDKHTSSHTGWGELTIYHLIGNTYIRFCSCPVSQRNSYLFSSVQLSNASICAGMMCWNGRAGHRYFSPQGHRGKAWKNSHETIWIELARVQPAGQGQGKDYSPPPDTVEFCPPLLQKWSAARWWWTARHKMGLGGAWLGQPAERKAKERYYCYLQQPNGDMEGRDRLSLEAERHWTQ